VNETIVM